MKITTSTIFLFIIKWILFIFLIKGITCIELVSLKVPGRVKKGSEVQISCLYDLGNSSLYSLKWFYRNHKNPEEQEFFRYTPREKPIKQVFPLEGINVDMQKSDGGTVYIRETNKLTSGNYKCEISVEGTFQTVAKEALMMVEVNQLNCQHKDVLCPDNSANHLAADPVNPHMYHVCSYGKVVGNFTCANEEVFDEPKQTCIEPVVVDKKCPSAEGRFSDPANPHQFIVCVSGHAFVFECAASLVWDDSQKKCVDNVDGKTWAPY